mmetsp:Transcript_59962/g.143181  ORF Transcript_59962/g.143181 Transcript_59962/m.143181 type:complete len:96 (+) Transcript_59962:61-348(+)
MSLFARICGCSDLHREPTMVMHEVRPTSPRPSPPESREFPRKVQKAKRSKATQEVTKVKQGRTRPGKKDRFQQLSAREQAHCLVVMSGFPAPFLP